MQPTPTRLDSAADAMSSANESLLAVTDLKTHFFTDEGVVKAVDGLNLSLKRGQTLCVVGESGCGKTTTGRCIARVYSPTSGQILYQLDERERVDLAQFDNRELRPFRREIRMIFQDPFSSLNPRLRNKGARIRLEGEVADPSDPPSGCYFHPRCPYAQDRCRHEEPPVRELGADHWVACHFAEELELRGFEAIGAARDVR